MLRRMSAQLPATREEGLRRLTNFLPRCGNYYARERNRDCGPGRRDSVSELSPWIRHRLITEQEVVAAAIEAQGFARAQKFIQEVCWRSYWKGWLQQRPAVWQRYCAERDDALARLEEERALAQRYARATEGTTGIDGFDDWALELRERGYLHNHARMSFASIWIFTLGLPWVLGADFFHRHLLDGDAASNTLSWRWVAGLQTAGKHYLASAEKIRFCSHQRFHPQGQLREVAEPLPAEPREPARGLARLTEPDPSAPSALLITEEDLHPESWPLIERLQPRCALIVDTGALRSPWPTSGVACAFCDAALADVAARLEAAHGLPCRRVSIEGVAEAAQAAGCRHFVGIEPTVGPLRDRLMPALEQACGAQALQAVWPRRPWDAAFWPHATRGYFALKKRIPETLRALGLAA